MCVVSCRADNELQNEFLFLCTVVGGVVGGGGNGVAVGSLLLCQTATALRCAFAYHDLFTALSMTAVVLACYCCAIVCNCLFTVMLMTPVVFIYRE